MGTSRSHPSPKIPQWQVPREMMGREEVPPSSQQQWLWRAAIAEKGAGLAAELTAPPFAEAVRLADRPLVEALPAFDRSVRESRTTTLFADLARRALARAVVTKGGGDAFGPELFAEATGYFASRDLPSVVGGQGRVQTARDSLALKAELRNEALARMGQVTADPRTDWAGYVSGALTALSGMKKP
jgi:hypothetical protein